MKGKIFLILFGFAIGVIFLEILFRITTYGDIRESLRPLLGQNVLSCRRKDPLLHHALVAKCKGEVQTKDYTTYFTTNSWGLRGKEFSEKKEKGVYRILFVGDSYVEGWGVSDNEHFITIAQDILKKQGKRVEIINAGVASYSPVLELEFLRTIGIKLHPDLVIMMVDPNDMHDEYFYGGWERHAKLRDSILPGTSNTIKQWPVNNSFLKQITAPSAFFSMLYERIKSASDTHEKKITLEDLTINSAIYAQGQDWENYEKAFTLLNDTIVLTDTYLQQQNINFVLTTSSRGAFHSVKEWDPGREVWGFDEGKVYKPKPIDNIKNLALKEGIPYIDVYQALQKPSKSLYFYPTDGHWTPTANKVVGETVAVFIEKHMSNRVQ